MNELRDVLINAQVSAQAEAPHGGDTHVHSTRTRIRRRRLARHAGAGAVGALALAGVAAATLWLPSLIRENPAVVPSPSVSPSPEHAPSPSPDSAGFVERAVTVIPGVLPDAQPLTEAVLSQVTSGWVLATYDGTIMDGENPVTDTGPWVAYLVSPTGERFEVGAIDTEATLAQWDVSRQVAWLHGGEDSPVSHVLDLRTGTFQPVALECGEGTYYLESVAVIESGWLVRHRCDSTGVAVGVSPAGTTQAEVPGVFVAGEGVTVRDLDGVQVAYTFGMPPEQKFRGERFDGTSLPLQLPVGFGDCYPHGPGRPGALAVQCFDGGVSTVWDLSLSGSAATAVVDGARRELISAALGHPGMGDSVLFPQYCGAGEVPVVVTDGLERPAAVALNPMATVVGFPNGTVEQCNSGTDDRVLLSAYGAVWTVDVTTNAVTMLVEPPERDATTYVRGAHAMAAIMAS
ncbi:MAG: hypothetical protein CVT64_03470 [Actinobacteria bacterium HGW-Actinobacteria-4]|nr:MAG: hypothetical protein CVT64_03470 [Actinobacteria bacterium HGW-Actinobacteria-4]